MDLRKIPCIFNSDQFADGCSENFIFGAVYSLPQCLADHKFITNKCKQTGSIDLNSHSCLVPSVPTLWRIEK